MSEEEKEEEKKYKVEIIARDLISVYPKLKEEHKQVIVTYRYNELPTRAITIDLFEHFKEKQEEVAKAIEERKGDLWQKYLELEKKLIKEDIERAKAARPETYTL